MSKRLAKPQCRPGKDAGEVKVSVRDRSGTPGARPLTGGVPIPEGAAPTDTHFSLADAHGRPVPLQTQVLGQWKDGSARWVLLDFVSAPPPNRATSYRLRWGGAAESAGPGQPVSVADGERAGILSGGAPVIETLNAAALLIGNRLEARLVLFDQGGVRREAQFGAPKVEATGPVRATVTFAGAFPSDGERSFSCRLRVSAYAGSSRLRLEPMILVDAEAGVVQRLQALRLELAPRSPIAGVRLGGVPKQKGGGSPSSDVCLLQVDDERFEVAGLDGEGCVGYRAPGWLEWTDGAGTLAAALRDFWQQWPKALTRTGERLGIDLLPFFKPGCFDHLKPAHKHGYLFAGNCYRLRTGQARRWEVWLDLQGAGEALARSSDAPLVPAAEPAAALATGVWGGIAAAGAPGLRAYDRWADAMFEGYQVSIAAQRDYGAMNWGDWYGERFVNWGNHEYDTPRHLLVQFARTGDPRYFVAGDTAARHMAEVDVVHAVNPDLDAYFREVGGGFRATQPSRPGMVHEHCVGHVGGFHPIEEIREIYRTSGLDEYDAQYLCLEPHNLGHVWTEGLVAHYWLTGDPWTRETIDRIADNLARLVEEGKHRWMGWSHCGRETGWPMLALAAAYELEWSPRYEAALRRLADLALAEQDPGCGGWLYTLPPDHCTCKTGRHVGKAGFILSILVNGLAKYGELSGDPRIPAAVGRAITHLNNDTWKDERSDWRYTSCPASQMIQQIGVTILSLVNSVRLTGDPEHLRILRKAWAAKFARLELDGSGGQGQGKAYSHTMTGAAEAASLLAGTQRPGRS